MWLFLFFFFFWLPLSYAIGHCCSCSFPFSEYAPYSQHRALSCIVHKYFAFCVPVIHSSLGLLTCQGKLHKTPVWLYSTLFLYFMTELMALFRCFWITASLFNRQNALFFPVFLFEFFLSVCRKKLMSEIFTEDRPLSFNIQLLLRPVLCEQCPHTSYKDLPKPGCSICIVTDYVPPVFLSISLWPKRDLWTCKEVSICQNAWCGFWRPDYITGSADMVACPWLLVKNICFLWQTAVIIYGVGQVPSICRPDTKAF